MTCLKKWVRGPTGRISSERERRSRRGCGQRRWLHCRDWACPRGRPGVWCLTVLESLVNGTKDGRHRRCVLCSHISRTHNTSLVGP